MPYLKPDTRFVTDDEVYILEKYLGSGVIGEVYRAHRESDVIEKVAVKVTKLGLSESLQQGFNNERDILGEFVNTLAANYVPQYVGQGKIQERTFLVMEFVQGQDINAILDRYGPLPEPLALQVAKQTLIVLQVLHDELNRTYTDLQIQNIWWPNFHEQQLENPQSVDVKIKIIDWNTTSKKFFDKKNEAERFRELVDTDLTFFSKYLYKFLTGKIAQVGDSEFALKNRAEELWQDLSLGTRRIVQKGLHWNAGQRYQTAQKYLDDITVVAEAWQYPLEKIAREIEMTSFPSQEKVGGWEAWYEGYQDEFNDLQALFDIYRRKRGVPETLSAFELVKDFETGRDPQFGLGLRYYNLGQYGQSVAYFQELIDQERGRGKPTYWRWFMLAKTCSELGMGQEHYSSLLASLEDYVKNFSYQRVRDKNVLKEYLGDLSFVIPEAATSLIAEAEFLHTGFKALDLESVLNASEKKEASLKWRQVATTTGSDIPWFKELVEILQGSYAWPLDFEERAEQLQVEAKRIKEVSGDLEKFEDDLSQKFSDGLKNVEDYLSNQEWNTELKNTILENWFIKQLSKLSSEEEKKRKFLNLLVQVVPNNVLKSVWFEELERLKQKTKDGTKKEIEREVDKALENNHWERVIELSPNFNDEMRQWIKQEAEDRYQKAKEAKFLTLANQIASALILTGLGEKELLEFDGDEHTERFLPFLSKEQKQKEITAKLNKVEEELFLSSANIESSQAEINQLKSEIETFQSKLGNGKKLLERAKDLDKLVRVLSPEDLKNLSSEDEIPIFEGVRNIKEQLQTVEINKKLKRNIEQRLDTITHEVRSRQTYEGIEKIKESQKVIEKKLNESTTEDEENKLSWFRRIVLRIRKNFLSILILFLVIFLVVGRKPVNPPEPNPTEPPLPAEQFNELPNPTIEYLENEKNILEGDNQALLSDIDNLSNENDELQTINRDLRRRIEELENRNSSTIPPLSNASWFSALGVDWKNEAGQLIWFDIPRMQINLPNNWQVEGFEGAEGYVAGSDIKIRDGDGKEYELVVSYKRISENLVQMEGSERTWEMRKLESGEALTFLWHPSGDVPVLAPGKYRIDLFLVPHEDGSTYRIPYPALAKEPQEDKDAAGQANFEIVELPEVEEEGVLRGDNVLRDVEVENLIGPSTDGKVDLTNFGPNDELPPDEYGFGSGTDDAEIFIYGDVKFNIANGASWSFFLGQEIGQRTFWWIPDMTVNSGGNVFRANGTQDLSYPKDIE